MTEMKQAHARTLFIAISPPDDGRLATRAAPTLHRESTDAVFSIDHANVGGPPAPRGVEKWAFERERSAE
jgi:hypothetical protein